MANLVVMLSGSRGLAEKLVADLSARGHQISVLVRRQENADKLRKDYPGIECFVADLNAPETPAAWTSATLKRFGRIDCLINNAAIQGPGGLFHTLDIAEIELTLETDLLAPVRLIHHVLKLFAEKGQGTIINLSGGGATAARPRFAPYAISKCALVRLTETLAVEYPKLRFYAVAPGTMKTQMTESILQLGAEVAGAEYAPLKEKLDRGGDGTERASALITYLAEERPARLSGKLASAIWDEYRSENADDKLSELWTLRRVDRALIERILNHEK